MYQNYQNDSIPGLLNTKILQLVVLLLTAPQTMHFSWPR